MTEPGDATVIDIRGLTKSFGRTVVLDQLDLNVVQGEVHGFLGPNGSGKTTTLRVLLGLLRADAGLVRLLGGDPWDDTALLHRRLAYVPGDVTLWPGLSGGEIIDLLGRLRGGVDSARRAALIEQFDLDPTKKARTYSKGNRQKVALVAALASDVELLLLDEPTSGLDPLMEATFRTCVNELRERGRTILLSSHILSEVEALCDRVSIIRAGRVVESGSISQLRHLTRTTVRAELTRPAEGLEQLPGVHDVQVEGLRVSASVEPSALPALTAALSAAGVTSLTSSPPTLEELFLRHYELPRTMTGQLLGTPALVRLGLRRDRWLIPTVVLGFAGMAASSAAATVGLYPDEASRRQAALTINATPALVALYGPVVDPSSLGAIALFKLTALGAAMVAIVMVVLVVRHTRSEEEAGRLELVGAGVVGRSAPLTAALLVVGGTCVILGLATTVGLVLAGLPVAGSVAFGAGWAATGLCFTAIAAIAAQVTIGGRAAIGWGITTVGIAYVLRAVGDLADPSPGWVSWLSPIGWFQQVRAFSGEQWGVLALPLVATAALVPVAYVLRARRDLGTGLLPDRLGPPVGRLSSALGLAWRLQRPTLLAWSVAVALLGGVLGSIAHSISGLLNNPAVASIIEQLGGAQGLTDAFLATEMGIVGTIVAAYAIVASERLRKEEALGHAEALLATAVTRRRWAASHWALALGSVVWLLLLAGLAAGGAHALAVSDPSQVGRVTGAALAQAPAAWVLVGLVVVTFAAWPRATPGVWALYVAFVVVGQFGKLWHVPQLVMDLSPFPHSPVLPGPDPQLAGPVGLVLVAVVLVAVGDLAFRRRDLSL